MEIDFDKRWACRFPNAPNFYLYTVIASIVQGVVGGGPQADNIHLDYDDNDGVCVCVAQYSLNTPLH